MNQNQITPPPYSADKFVDREQEIGLVTNKARDLAAWKSVSRRTVIFSGERGTGKSWLLAHLARTEFPRIPGVVVFLLSLRVYVGFDPILAVANILKDFRENVIGQQGGFGATLAEMSRQIVQEIRLLLREKIVVVLVDEVYEADWDLLAALEDYLLAPLAVEPRVLIVMAGRGRAYPWTAPELRLYSELYPLRPFPEMSWTSAQVEKQVSKKAAEKAPQIHELSGGNPLANYLLAVQREPAKALRQVIEGMLETVAQAQRQVVREYLEALCVLQAFDEERIPTLLAAYHGDPSYQQWSYAQARTVREQLVKVAFARWDEKKGGYVIDEYVRTLVERYLKQAQSGRWRNLHCAAYRLYEQWFTEYPRARSRWQSETHYHAEQLRKAGHNPEECAKLESEVATEISTLVSVPV